MISLQAERANGSVIGEAVDVQHPAQCGQHGVVGDEVAIRAGLAERRNRAEDERGVLAMESIPAEAKPVEGAGSEALDDDVGGAGELEQDVGAAGMVEIEREGALVEIVEPEEQAAVEMREVVEEGADAARVVAGGRFDLDDVGAHVGQQPRAKLGPMAGQVENPQARERAGDGLGHDFFADFPAPTDSSICASFCLTLGGGKSSIANAPVSSVAGTSIRTSFLGPVRLPPCTRMVSKVMGLTHRTPITAGFAWPSSSTGTRVVPSLSNRVTFLSPIIFSIDMRFEVAWEMIGRLAAGFKRAGPAPAPQRGGDRTGSAKPRLGFANLHSSIFFSDKERDWNSGSRTSAA